MLDVALLGTGGMIPLENRHLTSLLVRHNGRMLLIDCGEGTQVSMRELGWGFASLDYILFTHFHADHIAGLPGMLLSLSNYGRTAPLTIVGLPGIKEVVGHLRVIAPELMYAVEFIELSFDNKEPQSLRLGDLNVSALPLDHTMPCVGYSIRLPRPGRFDIDRAKERGVPMSLWSRLQKGGIIELDGTTYTPAMVLGEERKGLKLSYITDTRPTDAIPPFICGSDLFVCEGIYGDDSMKPKAERFRHMVFSDAARLAREGNVRELWLTHYSQAFPDPENYIGRISQIFENAKAGTDRMTKTLMFDS